MCVNRIRDITGATSGKESDTFAEHMKTLSFGGVCDTETVFFYEVNFHFPHEWDLFIGCVMM